jgi:HD-GYP domain-containing protein (c-di-GMP phosphodiesterase class II)
VDQLTGLRLKKDIVNQQGNFFISKNTMLTEKHIKNLMRLDILLTEDDVYQDIAQRQHENHDLVDEATKEAKELFNYVRFNNQIPINEVRNNIFPYVMKAVENNSIYSIYTELQSKDDYTYRHNIGVGIIATILGKWLNLSDSELSILTMGAISHDIGKVKIPNEILNKTGKLTSEEFNLMKKHTIYGYEIIKNTIGASHRIALVALQHHEREDGQGYPFGVTGDKIYYLSKIVAVADVFHAMSSKRVYHDAMPYYKVISQMQQDEFGIFDPTITMIFLRRMMESLVGQNVILTDGRVGMVVMINQHDPSNPLVKFENEFIDLSKVHTIHIEQIVD